jgi:hypothetical protein
MMLSVSVEFVCMFARPLMVTVGEQALKSVTLLARVTEMVFRSHGHGDSCPMAFTVKAATPTVFG